MKLLKTFPNATTFVEDDVLKGLTEDRLVVFAAGCEQRTIGNVANYNPSTGRIDFNFTLGGVLCVVLILF